MTQQLLLHVQMCSTLLSESIPLIFTFLCGIGLVPIILLYFVGHLDLDQSMVTTVFAGVSLASMFANITGMSLLVGLASAVETIASQLFGNMQFDEVGHVVHRSNAILGITSIPIAILWLNSYKFFSIFISPDVCEIVSNVLVIEIFGLPGEVILCTAEQYLPAIDVTAPLLLSSITLNVVLVISCYICTFILKFNYESLIWCVVLSVYASVAVLLLSSMRYAAVKQTYRPFSMEAFYKWGDFLLLGLAGVVMLCCEWWAYEFLTLIAGRLGNKAIDAQAIILAAVQALFCIPLGIGVRVAANVGNLIGSYQIEDAKLHSFVGLGLTAVVELLLALLVNVIGVYYVRIYTQDEAVIDITSAAMNFVTVFIFGDGVQCVGSSILRGAGKQSMGAWINLIAFYIVGLPMSWFLCFHVRLGVTGLIMGMSCANIIQVMVHLLLLCRFSDYVFAHSGAWFQYEPIADGIEIV